MHECMNDSEVAGQYIQLYPFGRINGRRGRGRPRTMWMDNIKEWTKDHIMTVSEWHKIENDGDP